MQREAAAEDEVNLAAPEDDTVDEDDNVDFENLILECSEPLFEGSRESRMQSGIVLMTLATVFGVSDTFLTALLTYLAGTLLPTNNVMPRTAYELKRMIRRLGLEHQRIDTCPNGHILYEGEVNGELTQCPRCMHPRYVPSSSKVLFAVTRYFPLIPKLRRLFKCPDIAELLNHFRDNSEDSSIMTSIVDSYQRKEVSRMFPTFRDLQSSLHLGLIADGVCPHGNQSFLTLYLDHPIGHL